ncbi:MAG: SDR family oxidoreductase [Acidobacteriota bacterium]|nr:SDR family oxidoreductase [Acidobacteriota bacterium]
MHREGEGRTALVTGASAGIGKAFAEVLAARGYRVVLTARRVERLEFLAEELTRTSGVSAEVIAADLADPSAPGDLVAEIARRGLHVDVLVNNAGYGVPGRFDHVTWAQHDAFLRVMIGAVCELSYRLVPGMAARGWGRVINVASLAGHLPAPAGHTLYAASKAFVIRFSEALHAERASDGVFVTALCPGFTLSEFHDVTGTRDKVSRLPGFMWMDARTVAEEGYAAVMHGRPVYINGRVNRTLARLARVFPQGIVRRLVGATGGRYRRMD